jgi:hypothetical protein
MRHIAFIAVCVGVLWAFDSAFFDGRYRIEIAEDMNHAALKFNQGVDSWLRSLRLPVRGWLAGTTIALSVPSA